MGPTLERGSPRFITSVQGRKHVPRGFGNGKHRSPRCTYLTFSKWRFSFEKWAGWIQGGVINPGGGVHPGRGGIIRHIITVSRGGTGGEQRPIAGRGKKESCRGIRIEDAGNLKKMERT